MDPALQPKTTAEVLAAYDDGVKKTKAALSTIGDAGLQKNWKLTKDGATIMGMPKVALVRAIVLTTPTTTADSCLYIADARHSGSVDLRTERRRKSVRGGESLAGRTINTKDTKVNTYRLPPLCPLCPLC